MDREGHAHDGSFIVWQDREPFLIDTKTHAGRPMWSHGQTAITEELYRIRERDGGRIVEEAENVQLHDLTTAAPSVTYEKDGAAETLECDFIAGCDGFHGVSRQSIPKIRAQDFRTRLSVRLARNHVGNAAGRRGHLRPARAGFRARVAAQSDAQPLLHPVRPRYARSRTGRTSEFWDELKRRFPDDIARKIVTGPSIEKSIAPLAQLRRRANALRPAVSRRRRRAYRPADRGERASTSRSPTSSISSARSPRIFSRATTAISRTIRIWR